MLSIIIVFMVVNVIHVDVVVEVAVVVILVVVAAVGILDIRPLAQGNYFSTIGHPFFRETHLDIYCFLEEKIE